jgi:hypothetical protein
MPANAYSLLDVWFPSICWLGGLLLGWYLRGLRDRWRRRLLEAPGEAAAAGVADIRQKAKGPRSVFPNECEFAINGVWLRGRVINARRRDEGGLDFIVADTPETDWRAFPGGRPPAPEGAPVEILVRESDVRMLGGLESLGIKRPPLPASRRR